MSETEYLFSKIVVTPCEAQRFYNWAVEDPLLQVERALLSHTHHI